MHLDPQMAEIRVDNRKGVNFEEKKIGTEPTFHERKPSNGKN